MVKTFTLSAKPVNTQKLVSCSPAYN